MSFRRTVLTWFTAGFAAAGALCLAPNARAADLRIGNASLVELAEPTPLLSSTLSTLSLNSFVVGSVPSYGLSALGLTPTSPVPASPVVRAVSGGLGSDFFNVGGEYNALLAGGGFGMFGSMAERSSLLAAAVPATAWNLGGSLGYAGFYLRAGLSATPAFGPLLGTQGWQAGFGFVTGALDLRVMYLTANSVALGQTEPDSQQWTLGGIYTLSSRVRLNADAFYGMRDSRTASLFNALPATGNQAPQGTGARVGVQLRF